jgi:hypothetical protein
MKKIFFSFLIVVCSIEAFSQGSELGLFGGGSYYLGDLNPGRQFYKTQPAFGVFYRRILNPRYAVKANLLYGTVKAFDSDSENPEQVLRNLNFRSRIIELSAQIEFNFLPYQIGDIKKRFSPYLFAGISGFRFDPQGFVNDRWVDLPPLSTEGQGTQANSGNDYYGLFQLAFPFGAGLKVWAFKRFGFSFEWGLRKTNTDYIDDVSTVYPDLNQLAIERGPFAASMSDRSLVNGDIGRNSGQQRGNSRRNDWYSFAGLGITYKIGPKIPKCPAYK